MEHYLIGNFPQKIIPKKLSQKNYPKKIIPNFTPMSQNFDTMY